jgi:putative PIN family toxin of toxin-antitoxin system
MRIVVDTNVLVSGVVNPTRIPGLVIEAAARGTCTLVITAKLWSELEGTLGYARVREFIARHGGETSVPVAVARLQTLAHFVPTESPTAQWFPEDPADNWVIQCAITGAADYIVTGDRALLALGRVEGIPTVSPREFIDEILKGTP